MTTKRLETLRIMDMTTSDLIRHILNSVEDMAKEADDRAIDNPSAHNVGVADGIDQVRNTLFAIDYEWTEMMSARSEQ